MNVKMLALFATGYMLAYAVDRWRSSGLFGQNTEQLYPLETSGYTFIDPSRPTIDAMRVRIMEHEAGLGDTLIHLG